MNHVEPHGQAGTSGTEPGEGTDLERCIDRCIEACISCHRVCVETARSCLACLEQRGTRAAAAHISLLIDCAQICATTAELMERRSPHHHLMCGACAEICRATAASCRRLGGEMLARCAEACDACAEACDAMADTSPEAERP